MDEKTRQRMQQLAEEKKPQPSPSRGVGDTVAKFTKALGVKPCGPCARRQQWLNQRFPYRTGK